MMMSGGTMDEVPLSNVTERDHYAPAHGQTADFKDTQAHNAQTRGKSRPVNKFTMTSAVVCHAILVGFTLYIIVLCFLDSYKLFLWHPALMTIGGFLLMAEAIMAMSPDNPITGKFGRSSRVQMHWILQALAASFMFIGFLIIVINKNLNNFHHFHTWHSIYGLIAVIMVGMTSSGGVGALYSVRFKQCVRPALIKLIHNTAGIITYIFSAVSIILSLYSVWFTKQKSYSSAGHYICIILICVSTLFTLQNATRSAFSRIIQTCQRQ